MTSAPACSRSLPAYANSPGAALPERVTESSFFQQLTEAGEDADALEESVQSGRGPTPQSGTTATPTLAQGAAELAPALQSNTGKVGEPEPAEPGEKQPGRGEGVLLAASARTLSVGSTPTAPTQRHGSRPRPQEGRGRVPALPDEVQLLTAAPVLAVTPPEERNCFSLSFDVAAGATDEPACAVDPTGGQRQDPHALSRLPDAPPARQETTAAQAETAVALRVSHVQPQPAALVRQQFPQWEAQDKAPATPPSTPPLTAAADPRAWAATAEPIPQQMRYESAPDTPGAEAPASMAAEPARLERPRNLATVQNLAIEIQESPQSRVEIRLLHRIGELQIAVRASDTDLAHAIRQGLPQLTHRLEQQEQRVEAWRPGGMPASPSADGRVASPESAASDLPADHRWSGPQDGRQNRERRDVPQWVQELDGAISETPGDLNGNGN